MICRVQEEIENLKRHTNEDINLVIKDIPTKKSPGYMISLTNSTKCLKN